MKKLAIIFAAALSMSAAMADSVSLEYQSQDVKGSQDNKFYGMRYTKNFSDSFSADVGTQTTIGMNDSKTTNRAEIGVTPSMTFSGVKLSARLATGEKSTLNNKFSYYSIQPGFSVPITSSLALNASYRYRTAYGEGHGDKTRTQSAGFGYKLSKVDTVAVRYDRVRGDVQQNNTALVYSRAF